MHLTMRQIVSILMAVSACVGAVIEALTSVVPV